MQKYEQRHVIVAEQFKPSTGVIPQGVRADGRGRPGTGSNQYMISTTDGACYLNEGDYIIRDELTKEVSVMKQSEFEQRYKPLEG